MKKKQWEFIFQNMNKAIINYLNIAISVYSDDDDFLEYIKKYFSIDDNQENLQSSVDIVVRFEKGYSLSPRTSVVNDSKIIFGENIGASDERELIFKLNELSVKFNFSEEKLWRISCSFKKVLFKHVANILFFRGFNTYKYYYRIISRMIIQNILFIKLKSTPDCCLLSAAAVSINNKVVIFSGLPGSGKSTLIKFIKDLIPSAVVMAENYVFIKDGAVFSFTEGNNKFTSSSFLIDKIFIVSRSDKFEIKNISKDVGVSMLRIVNQYTAEFPEHSPFIGAGFISNNFNHIFLEDNLEKLISNTEVNSLVVDYGLSEFKKYFLNYIQEYDR